MMKHKKLSKKERFAPDSPKVRGDGIKVRGFYRVQVENGDGSLAGDSGWCENTVVNNGFASFLCMGIASTTGAKHILGMNIGTGTAPNVTHDTLDGEISTAKRMGGTDMVVSQVAGSKTVRFTATFASTNSFISATTNIRNIGLFDCTTATGSLFAGSTYTASNVNTNQNINCTYDLSFS
jgi:hypothetical protein